MGLLAPWSGYVIPRESTANQPLKSHKRRSHLLIGAADLSVLWVGTGTKILRRASDHNPTTDTSTHWLSSQHDWLVEVSLACCIDQQCRKAVLMPCILLAYQVLCSAALHCTPAIERLTAVDLQIMPLPLSVCMSGVLESSCNAV